MVRASKLCRSSGTPREVTSAVSNSHGLAVADLVVVAPSSIPITTSGKVRRAACVDQYRQNQSPAWTPRHWRGESIPLGAFGHAVAEARVA
jgi:acyl-CoA synthetase (AMP-forming)/AMP-acid ligase II